MKAKISTLLSAMMLVFYLSSIGQGRQFITKINSNSTTTPFPALVDTPIGYNTSGKTYPLLVFLHGAGEASGTAFDDAGYVAGTHLSTIYNSAGAGGPAYFIAHNNWPDSFANPLTGVYEQFIVLTPQAPGWSTASNQLKYIINNFIAAGYRVDLNRIYLTGLSAGGQGVVEYSASIGTSPDHKPAALVPMSMAQGEAQAGAAQIVADKIRVWGFGQTTTNPDVHGIATANEIAYMNAITPGYARFSNYIGTSPHCCWNTLYTPDYKEVINGKSMNIYEWMLMANRGTPTASPTTVSAGTDQVITLPTDQVTLTGTATPSQGSLISTYLWTKVSGGAATITLTDKPTTTVTGLAQGDYVFQLLAIDNLSVSVTSQVKVTVKPVSVVSVPAANAGASQSIQLPVSQVTLNGTGSTVSNGTISTYAWSQQSGPATTAIASSGTATTAVTGLTASGTYVFKLTITDNNGNTNSTTVQVAVAAAAAAPPSQPSSCGGQRRMLKTTANDQGMWISPSNFTAKPGDTIVVSSKYRWSYLSGDGLHGTASCPIVIMNDTGQVELTAGIAFSNSTHVHITGTGSANHFYGFYVHSYDSIALLSRGASLQFSDRSAFCEIDHIDEYMKTYCMWLKEEAQCADSLRYPNWRLDNFSIHDIRAKNITQDGFYLGSTSPNGDRVVNCNGQNISPIPMRLSNIHIYNIILDSVGRTGIQLSGADSGDNQIYNCHVTRTGFEFNPQQGSGIILGGYTTAYVHDNYIRNTYQHGLSLLGAGLMRVENNDIDSSGYLEGIANVNFSNIAADTRVTTNQGATPPIYSTVYIKNNKLGVSTNRTGTKTAYRSIDIGYSYLNLPTWTNNNIICGNVLQDGVTPAEFRIDSHIGYVSNCGTPANLPPVANAGANKTITLPVTTVTQTGSGTDPDGTVASYKWAWISGPSQYTIATPDQSQTVINNLVQGTYQFQLTVTDNLGATNKDTVVIQVLAAAPANVPPVANAGGDQSITLPVNTITQTGSGTDADGTISSYQWVWISGPSQYTIVSPRQAQTVINNLVQGTYQFQLTVTDNAGSSTKDTVSIKVLPPANKPPVANAGANQTITLPVTTVTQTGSGTDPDGTVASYKWTWIAGPSQYTIVTPDQAQTVINNLAQGTYQFQLMVTDNQGLTNKDTVSIIVLATVPPANTLPVANAGGDQSITLPVNTVTQTGSGTDADGTISSYQWVWISGPSQYTIVSPRQAQTVINDLVQGTYQFQLTVTDNQGGTNASIVTIKVLPEPNKPPVANAGANQTITLPVTTVTQTGSGSDPDGTVASYKWAWISGPSQYTIVTPDQAQTVINNLAQGTYQFQLTVTDNLGLTNKDTVVIIVLAAPPPANKPPVANAGGDQSITLPVNTVTQTGSGTDADGTISSYQWAWISGPSQYTIVSPRQAQTVINNLVKGTYQFQLTVTDNQGATSTDIVVITVNKGANIPPVANPGQPFTTSNVTNVPLDGSASYDPDGTIVKYLWMQISGAGGCTISNSSGARPALYGLAPGVYVFQLTVTDNDGATNSAQVTVTVVAPPPGGVTGPVATAGKDTTVIYPQITSVTLDGSASYDQNGTIDTYVWKQLSGPGNAMISNTTSSITLADQLVPGAYQFELTVTDNNNKSSSDTITVTVRSNLRHDGYVKIYPNPVTNGQVTLQGENDYMGEAKFTVYDMIGRQIRQVVANKESTSFSQTIPLGGLQRGVYVVSVLFHGESKPEVYKLVID